jgi:hypothetical protein
MNERLGFKIRIYTGGYYTKLGQAVPDAWELRLVLHHERHHVTFFQSEPLSE